MYEVKESPLHGKGLFATETIRKGTLIGELAYRDATWREVQAEDMYVLWIEDDEPVYVTCEMRYINHAPEPNAAYFDDATVAAVRDILRGEEITHDYSGEGLAMDFGHDDEVEEEVELTL